jgi:AcrR family transcriptional regulator
MARAVRPYHHGDLRRALLEEAARLIESEGAQALTLREVARRLGVSHAAPAHHFPDKNALLAELGAEGFEQLTEALLGSMRERDTPAARLQAQGKAYVRFALSAPGHFRVMFGGSLRGLQPPPRLAEASERAYRALETAVAAVLGPARTRSARRLRESVFLAWSLVHGAATLLLDGALPGEPLSEPAALQLVDSVVASAVTTLTRDE